MPTWDERCSGEDCDMSNTKDFPRLPIVGEQVRLCGRLVEIQDVTPPVTTVIDYVFEEVSATVLVKANGLTIADGPTFNDFYGPPRNPAIAEAKKLAERYGPGVEVVVLERRQLVRKRPTGNRNFYAREFVEFESIRHGCRADLPDDHEEQVWSSKSLEEMQ